MIRRLFSVLFLLFVCSCSSKSSRSAVLVGYDPSFYPTEIGEETHNVLGYTLEVLQKISDKIDIHLVPFEMSWDNLIEGLKVRRYPFIISSMPKTLLNEAKFSFSPIFLATGPLLVVQENSSLKKIADFEDKILGIQRKSNQILLITQYPDVNFQFYTTFHEAFMNILEEKFDGALIPGLIAKASLDHLYQDRLQLADTKPIIDEGLQFISLKDQEDIQLRRITEAIEHFKKNGTLSKLQKKWNL